MNIRTKLIILVMITTASFILNISSGIINGSFFGVFSSDILIDIMKDIRIPRALTAVSAGGTFALCGAVFQSLFRNPIASPFTLGTASGAAFGVSLSVTFIGLTGFASALSSNIFAFTGALISAFIVFFVSGRRKDHDPNIMILTGVMINFFFSGLILLIQYMTDSANAVRITRWTMGSIDAAGMTGSISVMSVFLAGSAVILYFRNDLNLLYLGEEISRSRGVDPENVRKVLFISASVMISSVVAFTGPIGFIGIIAPHAAAGLTGKDYRYLIPASALTGASVLLICDIISRTVIWPAEVPAGIITALAGSPFLIRIISKNR